MLGPLTPSKGPKPLEQVSSQRHTEKSTFSKLGKLYVVAIRRCHDVDKFTVNLDYIHVA